MEKELVNGKSWWSTQGITAFMSRTQAGWDFRYLVNPDPATKTDQELREVPYFDDFREEDLTDVDPMVASAKAGEVKVRYDLLARAIPALSHAAAVMPIPELGDAVSSDSRNFDVERFGRPNGTDDPAWPTEGHTGLNQPNRWLHSDFRNVAIPYVYPIFETMINRGNLNEN